MVTDGRNVSLHVQAQDERAKKIIEESIGHLKDSMASQSLSLGAVDFSVAQSKNSASMDNRNEQGQAGGHAQGMFQDTLGQNAGNSNQQSGRGAWDGVGNPESGSRLRGMNAGSAAMSNRMVAEAARTAVALNSGRLDVTA